MKNTTVAIWIFNRSYLIPSFFSISSFLENFNLPVKIILTEKIDDLDLDLLESIGTLEIINYDFVHKIPQHKYYKEHMINRLARMDILEYYSKNFRNILMVDSDIIFAPGSNNLFFDLPQLDENNISTVFGVIENEVSSTSEFYFARKDEIGRRNPKIKRSEKINTWKEVFGSNWEILLNSKAFNNGFLLFHDCKKLAEIWRMYYFRGLLQETVNLEDDQVPLAAAMNKMGCQTIGLDGKYNSLGKVNGEYYMFHAYAGNWKWELKKIIDGENEKSDYANLAIKYMAKIPNNWIQIYLSDLDQYIKRVKLLQSLND